MKKKVLEMLYFWTVTLPEETKIADAYCMLKKQGEALQKLKITNFLSLHVALLSPWRHADICECGVYVLCFTDSCYSVALLSFYG